MTNHRYLRALQRESGEDEIVWAEPTQRRVRVFFGGLLVADSYGVLLVFKGARVPVYYFPIEDVRMELFEATEYHEVDPRLGERSYMSVAVGTRRHENALARYQNPIPDGPDLSSFVSFEWGAMDAWFEEDEEVLQHAHDPYKRVDVLHSSRRIRVFANGTLLAESTRPMLLFETGLPVRYYLPKLNVRVDLLIPSGTRTRCPYKGEAIYWSLVTGDEHFQDVVWSYPAPIPEIPKIENLLSFYNEKLDIEIDGQIQARPSTAWS